MANAEQRPSTNLRRFRRERDRNYLILVIFTLVVVGGGLIALVLGPEALLMALPCLLGGALLILVPWLLLTAVEKWRDRMEQADRKAIDSSRDMTGNAADTTNPDLHRSQMEILTDL